MHEAVSPQTFLKIRATTSAQARGHVVAGAATSPKRFGNFHVSALKLGGKIVLFQVRRHNLRKHEEISMNLQLTRLPRWNFHAEHINSRPGRARPSRPQNAASSIDARLPVEDRSPSQQLKPNAGDFSDG